MTPPRPLPLALPRLVLLPVLLIASSGAAGCYHSAEFKRVSPGADGGTTVVLPLERRVRLDVAPFQGGPQYEKHAAFVQALRDDAHVQLVSTAWTRPSASEELAAAERPPPGSGGRPLEEILRERSAEAERRRERAARDHLIDYHVTYAARVETSGRGVNFPICFPGFLIFMPAWYGLTWEYTVVSRIDIQRADGSFVSSVESRDEYICYYTSPQDGVNVNFGFTGFFPILLFGFITPFSVGIATAVGAPDLYTLDQAFLAKEGKAFGEAVKTRVLERIARDLRGEPVDGVLPGAGAGGGGSPAPPGAEED